MSKNRKKNIVIIGASGHAKVIIDIIESVNEFNIIGLIDSFKTKNTNIFNYQILGTENELPELMKIFNIFGGIIAIGDNWIRNTVFNKIITLESGFEFISAIHPKAIIGRNVELGKGIAIMAGVIINCDSKIDDFCILNTKSSLDHDSTMGKFSSLAPNSTVGGNVSIGEYSAICLGSNIIQDINIGKHSIIGAGSLVNRNIENYKMVYGSPAKVIRTIKKGEKYLYNADDYIQESEIRASYYNFDIVREKTQWDSLLEEIGLFDFYHTYDYHYLSKRENETPILLKYIENDIIIALPLLERQIDGTDYKDITSVYGYAGPICNTSLDNFDNSQFKEILIKYLKHNKFVSIFSRLNPFIPSQNNVLLNIGRLENIGKVVNINIEKDIDSQRKCYKSRLKTHINKAKRLCSVKVAKTDFDIQEFIDIYYENMNRVHAKKSYYFSKTYFQKIVSTKSFKSVILLASDNVTGKTIAGCLFIITNGIVQYHLSGTKNEFFYLNPTKLLIDEMRIMASNLGLKYFNLGGGLGGSDNDTLFHFKSGFSKDFKIFNLWKTIINEEWYNELVLKNDIITDTNYFPLYRYKDNIEVKL